MQKRVEVNLINHATFYLAPYSGASIDKAQGALIGVVMGLMAVGLTFDQAIAQVKLALPSTYRQDAIPPA
jgi:uncharacterized protein affecting Mg2+/Co2+ transport